MLNTLISRQRKNPEAEFFAVAVFETADLVPNLDEGLGQRVFRRRRFSQYPQNERIGGFSVAVIEHAHRLRITAFDAGHQFRLISSG